MLEQQDQLNGSAAAFIRAFSDLIKDSTSHLATKDDIANMATKDDIANMATKDDIANMATKDDIHQLSDRIDGVKADLNSRIDTTNKNMQAQFAEQEKKIAGLGTKITALGKKMSNIERKL